MNYEFEKNKLYSLLGAGLVSTLKNYKCFVAGGTITSLFCNRTINDIDVYFRDEKSCIGFVEECFEDNQWVNVLTKKSVMFTIDEKSVQAIHFNFFNNTEELFETFDFTACMGSFDFASEEFILHPEFLKHNSQRILKFNKNTAFPIVSLLRIQKYKEKGYSISKPEFLRIALRCMDLKIATVEDLRNHLGGMYGINYDKIITFEEGEEFSLDRAIDKIDNLALDEDYFKKPIEIKFDDIEDIIAAIQKSAVKVISHKGQLYRITSHNTLRKISNKPAYIEEISGEEFFNNNKFYKFVERVGSELCSHWKREFKYVIGETSEAVGYHPHLYFNEKYEIEKSSYKNKGVLIEVEINWEDFNQKDNNLLAKKCKVIREVPQEEYEKWSNEEDEE